MATIETCGSTLFYQRTGEGTPVLLLHSSACRGGFWKGMIEQVGPGFSCFTPDLAGYGKSACSYLGPDLRAQADFIAPLLWHGDETFHLIGHSFGGAVALAAALAWPNRVRSLTLYEPTAFSLLQNGSEEERRLFETIASVPTIMQSFLDAGSTEGALAHFVDFWNGPGSWAGKQTAEQNMLAPLAGKVVEDFRMLFEMSWKGLARLGMPTLLLRGDQSPPVAAKVAAVLAETLPTARLVTLHGLGHMAPVTDPAIIAPTVMEHLLLCDRELEFGQTAHAAG